MVRSSCGRHQCQRCPPGIWSHVHGQLVRASLDAESDLHVGAVIDTVSLCAAGREPAAGNLVETVVLGQGRGAAAPTLSTRAQETNVWWSTSLVIGSLPLKTALLLEDITLVSNAMSTTMTANPLDMNVNTFGSLLPRLSHHRNGLSTQPPGETPMPSKLPVVPPNRFTSPWVLQQSWPVSTPLAGIPARLNCSASVPTGENASWFRLIELK